MIDGTKRPGINCTIEKDSSDGSSCDSSDIEPSIDRTMDNNNNAMGSSVTVLTDEDISVASLLYEKNDCDIEIENQDNISAASLLYETTDCDIEIENQENISVSSIYDKTDMEIENQENISASSLYDKNNCGIEIENQENINASNFHDKNDCDMIVEHQISNLSSGNTIDCETEIEDVGGEIYYSVYRFLKRKVQKKIVLIFCAFTNSKTRRKKIYRKSKFCNEFPCI